MNKKLSLSLAIACFYLPRSVAGQVAFTEAPKTYQLYARALSNDSSVVAIQGTVNRTGANYSELRVKAYRNNVPLSTLSQILNFTGNTAPFAFLYPIKAELASYKFEVVGWNGSLESVIRSADSVVGGDVYIIQGQSNAEALMYSGSANANQSPYIRVLGSGNNSSAAFDTAWRIGQGDGGQGTAANTGQWGLRMARQIVDNQKIPIAIFNGSYGGQPISVFQRNDATPELATTNYGRLLRRVKNARLTQAVRAIFWVQGENNNGTSTASYKTAFQALRSDWLADYPNTGRIYIFQVRNGCGHSLDELTTVKEAHRQLAWELPNTAIMSMSGLTHESGVCHFPFVTGYEMMGNDIYRLLSRDFYGADPGDNVEAPSVKFAEISGNSEATLILKNIMDSITWYSGSQSQFRLTGISATVSAGTAYWNKVRLTLSGAAASLASVTFLGAATVAPEPMVRNIRGIGAVHFNLFPITTPQYRDSVSVAEILRSNGLAVSVASVAVYGADRRIIGLNLNGRNLTALPADIGYLDSLKSLDLGANALSALPREITKLPALGGVNLDQNRLCSVSGVVANWIPGHANNAAWQATQTQDGVNACASTRIVAGKTKNRDAWNYSVGNGRLTFRFEPNFGPRRIRIVRADGVLMAEHRNASAQWTFDVSRYSRGAYWVQIVAVGSAQTRKIALF